MTNKVTNKVTNNPLFVGVQCPEMNDLPYGRVYGRTMTYGNRIGFRCDYGYTLVGSEQRLCLSDGTWSGTDPTCVRGYFSRESNFSCLGVRVHVVLQISEKKIVSWVWIYIIFVRYSKTPI